MKTKTIRCEQCKGTGVVQIALNVKGLKICPRCNGRKKIKMKWVDYDAGEDSYEDEHKGHWEVKSMKKIFKEREAFAKKIFNLAYEKLKEHENETMYMCDIGMALTMKENELGYFCSEKESLKNIKKYFYEFVDFINWYNDSFGEMITTISNIQKTYCMFIICAVENACSSVFTSRKYFRNAEWNDKVFIDKNFISDFKKVIDNDIGYNIF